MTSRDSPASSGSSASGCRNASLWGRQPIGGAAAPPAPGPNANPARYHNILWLQRPGWGWRPQDVGEWEGGPLDRPGPRGAESANHTGVIFPQSLHRDLHRAIGSFPARGVEQEADVATKEKDVG